MNKEGEDEATNASKPDERWSVSRQKREGNNENERCAQHTEPRK